MELMHEFSWDQMPEPLADMLAELLNTSPGGSEEMTIAFDIKKWLQDNIQICGFTMWAGAPIECGQTVVPGSDRCQEHINIGD